MYNFGLVQLVEKIKNYRNNKTVDNEKNSYNCLWSVIHFFKVGAKVLHINKVCQKNNQKKTFNIYNSLNGNSLCLKAQW